MKLQLRSIRISLKLALNDLPEFCQDFVKERALSYNDSSVYLIIMIYQVRQSLKDVIPDMFFVMH